MAAFIIVITITIITIIDGNFYSATNYPCIGSLAAASLNITFHQTQCPGRVSVFFWSGSPFNSQAGKIIDFSPVRW